MKVECEGRVLFPPEEVEPFPLDFIFFFQDAGFRRRWARGSFFCFCSVMDAPLVLVLGDLPVGQ